MEIILRANTRIEVADESLVPTTFKEILQAVWPDHDCSNLADESVGYRRDINGIVVAYEPYRSRILLSVAPVRIFRGSPTRRWVSLHHTGKQRVRLDVAQLRQKHLDLIPLAEARSIERAEINEALEARKAKLDGMYVEANLVPNMSGDVHIREIRGSDSYSVTYASHEPLTPGAAVEIAKVIKAVLTSINR